MMVELAGTPLAPGNYFTESKLGSDAGRQLVQKDRRYGPDWVVRMLFSIFGFGYSAFHKLGKAAATPVAKKINQLELSI